MTEEFKKVKILYEDTEILVCVKPAGTACETKKAGQQDMVSLLRNYRKKKREEPYIGLVHRLDQPVEGILVFGKSADSSAALSRQLTQGKFVKEYLAVTEGKMPAQEGTLEDFLKKDGRNNTSCVVSPKERQAKKAKLRYQVITADTECCPQLNLVKIHLLTGRHHQIRVQMSHLGTPLAGDRKYGSMRIQPPDQTETKIQKQSVQKEQVYSRAQKESGLGLCACALAFCHPVTGKQLRFEIKPSGYFFHRFFS